jgi:hypothetical protein
MVRIYKETEFNLEKKKFSFTFGREKQRKNIGLWWEMGLKEGDRIGCRV